MKFELFKMYCSARGSDTIRRSSCEHINEDKYEQCICRKFTHTETPLEPIDKAVTLLPNEFIVPIALGEQEL
jgi:hypothetical protein